MKKTNISIVLLVLGIILVLSACVDIIITELKDFNWRYAAITVGILLAILSLGFDEPESTGVPKMDNPPPPPPEKKEPEIDWSKPQWLQSKVDQDCIILYDDSRFNGTDFFSGTALPCKEYPYGKRSVSFKKDMVKPLDEEVIFFIKNKRQWASY